MDVLTFPENLLTTSGSLILMHDVLSLPDATPCDNIKLKFRKSEKIIKDLLLKLYYLGLDTRKPAFRGLRTTQAHTNLRIGAV